MFVWLLLCLPVIQFDLKFSSAKFVLLEEPGPGKPPLPAIVNGAALSRLTAPLKDQPPRMPAAGPFTVR